MAGRSQIFIISGVQLCQLTNKAWQCAALDCYQLLLNFIKNRVVFLLKDLPVFNLCKCLCWIKNRKSWRGGNICKRLRWQYVYKQGIQIYTTSFTKDTQYWIYFLNFLHQRTIKNNKNTTDNVLQQLLMIQD